MRGRAGAWGERKRHPGGGIEFFEKRGDKAGEGSLGVGQAAGGKRLQFVASGFLGGFKG